MNTKQLLLVGLVVLAVALGGCSQPAEAPVTEEEATAQPVEALEDAEADADMIAEEPPEAAEEPVETITLRYANFPPAPTFPCVQMERWVDEAEEATGGQVEIQTFPGSTLLGAKDMFDGVVNGVADIGNFAMSYQPGRFPVSEAVDLPWGFSNATVASMVLHELLEKYQPAEFEDVKVLAVFTCPPSNFMTSQPVRTLDDLSGMELRVSGTGAEVISALGGTDIAMPQSETPDAIQKGVVKGLVSSLDVLKDMNYAVYCPYVTIADLYVVSFAVIMNKDKWESLPADVRDALDGLAKDQALWTGNYVMDHAAEALDWATETQDVEVFELPAADREQIAALVQPMIDAYIERANEAGLPGAQIVADVKALMEKYEAEYGTAIEPAEAPAAADEVEVEVEETPTGAAVGAVITEDGVAVEAEVDGETIAVEAAE